MGRGPIPTPSTDCSGILVEREVKVGERGDDNDVLREEEPGGLRETRRRTKRRVDPGRVSRGEGPSEGTKRKGFDV